MAERLLSRRLHLTIRSEVQLQRSKTEFEVPPDTERMGGALAKSPDFLGIEESLSIPVPDKSPWRFSTRDDYIRFLIKRGDISEAKDLLAQTNLVLDVQRHWHGRAQHACRFAQLMGKFPGAHGWATLVVSEKDETSWPDEIWDGIRARIQEALADERTQALSIFAPGVLTGPGLVRLLRDLKDKAGWSMTEARPPAYPEMLTIGLRLSLPTEPAVASWAVGFGPFSFLPLTRQAPFTEIAFATKPKPEKPRSHRLSKDRSVAHLADIPINIPDKTFETWWPDTQKGKKIILGGADDSIAKAKVTYAVPATLWEQNS